jgi:hypothetical protein
VARILAAPGSLARLTLPHTLRVVGVLFLMVMALGHLPALFALPAGLGDIAVGLIAPSVARRLTTDGDHRGAVRFHLLGLLDLVVAITIGYLAGLGPYRPPGHHPLHRAAEPAAAGPGRHRRRADRARPARRVTHPAPRCRPHDQPQG